MKTRYRPYTQSWSGNVLLVLQVGFPANTGDSDDIPPSNRNKDYTAWRDATVEDLPIIVEDEDGDN